MVLDEVLSAPSGFGTRQKMTVPVQREPTVLELSNKLGNHKFFGPAIEQTRKEENIKQEADKMLRRKLLEEDLVQALKNDPFLLARIQGLKNLQENQWR